MATGLLYLSSTMLKPLPIQISIPQPCHEDWDKMTPEEQGRFCSRCQKCVIDFTSFTDSQLYEYMIKHRNNDVCGKFRVAQLDKYIEPHFYKSRATYSYVVALGITLIFSQLPDNAYAKPITELVASDNDTNDTTTHHAGIRGIIKSKNNTVLSNVTIEVRDTNYNLVGTTKTNSKGKYKININTGSYIVYIQHQLHIAKQKRVIVKNVGFTQLNMNLIPTTTLPEIVIAAYKQPIITNDQVALRSEDIEVMGVRTVNTVVATTPGKHSRYDYTKEYKQQHTLQSDTITKQDSKPNFWRRITNWLR